MAERAHPKFSKYQQKIIEAKAFSMGVNPAVIVKEGIHKLTVEMTEKERNYLLTLWETLTPEQRRNPTK